MDHATKKIVVEAIKTAIITELRGYEIYKAAADRTTDPAAKLMFEKLAEDEGYHKEFLEKNFKSVLETGEWAVPATPQNLSPLDHSDIVNRQQLTVKLKARSFRQSTTTERPPTTAPTKSRPRCSVSSPSGKPITSSNSTLWNPG